MDLSEVESFDCFFDALWKPMKETKCEVNILDTIVFSDGKPSKWLFTSEKTGVIFNALIF